MSATQADSNTLSADTLRNAEQIRSNPENGQATQNDSKISDEEHENVYISGSKLVFLLTSLTLAVFLMFLDTSIVSTAVPKITDDFKSLDDVGWYGSAYMLGSSSLQLLTGSVYKNFKLKWSFIGFFAIFEIGSAICGAAQSSAMFIVGRAIGGAGGSGLVNGALTILSTVIPLEQRPKILGILLGVSQLGIVMGPLIGGAFTTGYTWRWCFYINLPLGFFVAVGLFMIQVPENVAKIPAIDTLRQIHKHFDLVGFVLFAPAVIMLLLAMQFGGNEFPWHSSQIIGLFVGAGVAFIVWLVWNARKGEDALLPLRVVGKPNVWVSGLCMCFLSNALLGGAYYLPLYFQAVQGVSAVMSGVYLLATILPQLAAAVTGGILTNRVGRLPPFAILGGGFLAISCGLFTLFQPDTPKSQWVGFQILGGIGRGLAIQIPILAVQHATTAEDTPIGMAFVVWCQYIGPAVFLGIFNTLFITKLRIDLRNIAPNVNTQAVIAAGATHFRKVVSPADLPLVLKAYSDSLDDVFYLITATSLVCFLSAWFLDWKKITKKNEDGNKDPGSSTSESTEDGKQTETDTEKGGL